MIPEWLKRSEILYSKEAMEYLRNSHVAIVGVGGVGGFAAETICRSGVGKITIVDGDSIDPTNRNRQIVSLATNHHQPKVLEMKKRLEAISQDSEIFTVNEFLHNEGLEQFLDTPFDYLIDAIDTLSPKIQLIASCKKRNLPLISSLGAGGKSDPTQIQISDISKTYQCQLAKFVRKRLHRIGIFDGVEVVWSAEEIDKSRVIATDKLDYKASIIGTNSWMPPIFGAFCTSVVIRNLIAKYQRAKQ